MTDTSSVAEPLDTSPAAAATATTASDHEAAAGRPSTPLSRIRHRVGDWAESRPVQNVILVIIIANAITLGMHTSDGIMAVAGEVITTLDTVFLWIFVAEILAKLFARGWRFFGDGWNVFDFLVVGIALVPATGPLAVMRALRVLRVLRLVSVVPQLRFIVSTLLAAIPGIASIGALLAIVFYVAAVMSTELFSASFPELFGSITTSLFTLFQVMTLDSWSSVVRPVMEVYPAAWLFFVPFIIVSALTMLNLFIAVIVDTMQNVAKAKATKEVKAATDAELEASSASAPEADDETTVVSDEALIAEITEVRARLDALTDALVTRSGSRTSRDGSV